MPFDAGGPFGEDNSIKSIKALQSIDSRRRDPFLLDVSSAEQTGTDYCLINSETVSKLCPFVFLPVKQHFNRVMEVCRGCHLKMPTSHNNMEVVQYAKLVLHIIPY